MFKKCIKADLISIKKLMEFNERELNYKNLMEYSSAFNIEVFEAPLNHMKRIWNLKSARIILDKYPDLARNYMGNIFCLNKAIYMETHKLLSKTVNKKMNDRYISSYSSDKSVKLMKYLFDHKIKLTDLDDPDFDEEEFEDELKAQKTPIKKKHLSLMIMNETHDANSETSINREVQDVTISNETDSDIEVVEHIQKKKKTDTGLAENWGKLTELIRNSIKSQILMKPSVQNLDSSTQTETECCPTRNIEPKRLDSSTQTEIENCRTKIKLEKKEVLSTLSQTETEHFLTNEAEKDSIKKLNTLSRNSGEYTNNTLNTLSRNLNKFYENGKFCDVFLYVNTSEIFRAHSCVLGCYSEVFSKKLEQNTNIFNLSNTSVSAVSAMLKYMYTNKIENLEEVVTDLMLLASEYEILELVEICEQHIVKNISIKNVLKIALTAYKCKSEQLKEIAKKFFALHMKEIIETDGFKELRKADPNLVIELLCYQVNISSPKKFL